MRADVVRTYKEVHSWVGIVSGMALFIAFFAGALTIFKAPLVAWATPPVENAVLPENSDAKVLVDTVLQTHPEAHKTFTLDLSMEGQKPPMLYWREGANPAHPDDKLSGQHFSAWLNQQGDVSYGDGQGNGLGDVIDVLHRVVGLPIDSEQNRWVMGFFSMLYAFALTSGLILVMPRLARELFALRLGANLKRMWMDAHNIVGITSLPFHIVIALTAVTFAFHDPVYELQKMTMHGGQGFAMGQMPPTRESYDPTQMLSPEALLEKAASLSKDFLPKALEYRGVSGPMPMVQVWGDAPSSAAITHEGSFIMLDPYTGEVISADYLPGKLTAGYATINSLFALHFGSYGGSLVSWAYFLMGLSGAWLFYSGNLLWLESRRRKQKQLGNDQRQSISVRYLGSATVGVCLGCVAGIAVMIASEKWLYGRVTHLVEWHQVIYYSVFFSSIVWAFWRGAARAAVELLWCCAFFVLLIPLTSFVSVIPGISWWAHGSIESVTVDVVALLASLGLAIMARATLRRIHHGPTDSLWSAAEFQKVAPVAS